MDIVSKFQTFIILFSVMIGITIGQIRIIEINADHFILPFLIVMLYGVFIHIPLSDLKKSLKNIKFTFTSVSVNFIWTPIFAWVLGYIFLKDVPQLWIGFIMLMVTPCTDWYLIFTGIAKGNVALGTSILPTNFILQLLLLPAYLLIFGGSMVQIDTASLFEGIVYVLIVPLILAHLSLTILTKKKGSHWLQESFIPKIASAQSLFLNLAIIAMFASQGKLLMQNYHVLIKLLIPVLIFFVINFIIVQFIGRSLKFNYEDQAALNLTTLARNSPIALAIAAVSFPDKPLISLALIIGPLIELPVLALVSQILLRIKSCEDTMKDRLLADKII